MNFYCMMPKQKPQKKGTFRGNQYTKGHKNSPGQENGYHDSDPHTSTSDTHSRKDREKEIQSVIAPPSSNTPTAADDSDTVIAGRRKRRIILDRDGQSACCICGLTVRRQDLEAHYKSEIDQLEKLTNDGSENMRYRFRRRNMKNEDTVDMESNDRYEEYLRLLRKRETRLRKTGRAAENGGLTNGPSSSVTQCPVCHVELVGTPEERNRHAEICLNRLSGGPACDVDDNVVDIDIEGDGEEEYEEYTWCGQTRIRATTLVEGGLEGLGYKTVTTKEENNEVELDVEGDDTAMYGTPQYTEGDLVEVVDLDSPVAGQEEDQGGGIESNNNNDGEGAQNPSGSLQFGNNVASGSNDVSGSNDNSSNSNATNNTLCNNDASGSNITSRISDPSTTFCPSGGSSSNSAIQRTFDPVSLAGDFYSDGVPSVVIHDEERPPVERQTCSLSCNHDAVVQSLKRKIEDLEKQVNHQTPVRCLICLDPYNKPLVSIQCWHVYCEDCWMKTLGHKRLCPQCQMITSPSQLRQIYL